MLKSSISLEPKVSTLKDVSLFQALEWVAFELSPLDFFYDSAFRSEHRGRKSVDPQYDLELEQAKKLLFIALKQGYLAVNAGTIDLVDVLKPDLANKSTDVNGSSYVGETITPPMLNFDHILWSSGSLKIYDANGDFFNGGDNWYFAHDVTINANDLFKIFPPSKPDAISLVQTELSTYLPYYMALMQEAISDLGITSKNQLQKKVIIEWFLEQDSKLSRRGVESMATLIRLPEKKKGGWYTPNDPNSSK